MSDVVIVAIPRENDPTWRYSSEKVPHMTLLYLGEVDDDFDIPEVAAYLEHVTNGAEPFGLDVDYRGTLGDDEADVLFFKKGQPDMQKPRDIINYLLQNPYILKAYEAQQQYSEWTPHLTMGYESAPARPDTREYPGFSWVQFDRLALWIDDSDGPTYTLEYGWESDERPVIMSDAAEIFLAHHGVKGMKWGVRRSSSTPVITSKTTIVVKGDEKKRSSLTKAGRYQKKNADTAVTIAQRPNTRLTTKGGANRKPHEDAVKAAVNSRIAKTSTTDALSTKELQELVNRMNLEQQYSRLTAEPENPFTKAGKAMLGDLLKTEINGFGKRHVSDALIDKGLKPESDKDKKMREDRQAKFEVTKTQVKNFKNRRNVG